MNMKKYAVIAALLALLTALAACGVQTLPTDEDDVPPVEGISQTQEDGQTGTKDAGLLRGLLRRQLEPHR
jgi:predicted small lipoprotein YifL